MSTPNKRRKKNDFQSSPQAVRSLDFFFGKQKKEQDNNAKAEHTDGTDGGATAPESLLFEKDINGSFTDEELARQLQDEWNEQDRKAQAKQEGSALARTDKKSPNAENVSDSLDGQNLHTGGPSITVTEQNETGKKAVLSLQSATTAEDNITSIIPFDENPLVFDPSKYLPDLKAHWTAEGGDASYALLTRCFILVNSTQSRIKIVDTLVNLIRTIIEGDPESLLPMVRIRI